MVCELSPSRPAPGVGAGGSYTVVQIGRRRYPRLETIRTRCGRAYEARLARQTRRAPRRSAARCLGPQPLSYVRCSTISVPLDDTPPVDLAVRRRTTRRWLCATVRRARTTPEDLALHRERLRIVSRVTAGLEVARAKFVEDLPEKEIARRQNLTRSSVASRLKRTRKLLLQALDLS